jgi:AraC family transcriptional regulator
MTCLRGEKVSNRTATHPNPAHLVGYTARINRAIDHIVRNLAEPLLLADVAQAASFSPFHFHRVFKAQLGQTLQQFVNRLRLERSLYLMSHASKRSLTDVALQCGFASSADFSRSFKHHYGVAPRQFDLQIFRNTKRTEFEQHIFHQIGAASITAPSPGENPDGFSVQLRDLPARTVAYIRVFDPYREGVVQAASARLVSWALDRGLADGQWLGYMWEEPEIVALADCRYDVALVVNAFKPTGDIGRFDFPPMRVAEVNLSGDIALESRAIDWVYKTWLPHSAYVPDDQPAFEAWKGLPFAHGTEHFELAFQLPVKAQ